MADGNHLDIVGTHIAHDFAHVLVCFAQADHDAGFGWDMWHHFFIATQKLEGVLVVGTRTGFFIQAWMGFQVVVHHVGWCFCQDFQCDVQTAAEIGNEDFDFGIRAGFADGFNTVGEVLCATITQVVTVDGSNHDIAQVHGFDGFGQVFRLVRIQHVGAAMANVAERATAGTNITHDHECGRTLGKAFADVWTRCFFAYGMHFLFAKNVFDFKEFLAW